METIQTVSKSSITDLKSHSISSIASITNEAVPQSPQPTKTRSFDDRDSLRTAATASDLSAGAKGIDCTKAGDASQENRKSSENISLHCESNEPNANVRHEHISAKLSNASDTNLDGNSLLSDGAKVRSESLSLSASPPTITVMCAPCIDDMLAEQQQAEQIDCDVSDNEEIVQYKMAAESTQYSKDIGTRKLSSPTHDTSNLQLTLDVKKTDATPTQQEDLSPSMDEYEECNPTSGDYQYDSISGGEMLVPGCVAPAPTPAPLIAPLAEIEVDPPDDEMAVSGIEKPPDIKLDSQPSTDAESTAKPQLQQQQSQTSRTKKKKQKSTDKGKTDAVPMQNSRIASSLN